MSRLSTVRLGASTLAIAVVAGVLLTQLLVSAGEAEGAGHGRSLVGTWELQVSPVDCATGAPVAPPFSSLHNYTRSGTMTEEGSVVGPPPVFMRTSGLGVWRREGGRTFRAFFKIYRFDSNAAPLDRSHVELSLKLAEDRDELVGAGVITTVALDGTELASICSTSTGRRLELPE
jgi:hypothetical protein